MKDSGVQWMGDIPNNWEESKIKYNFGIIGGCGFCERYQGESEGDYPFCKASDLNGSSKTVSTAANYVSKELVIKERYNIIPSGSILFAKIGESLKKNHRKINTVDCIVDNNCQAIYQVANNDINYMFYLFKHIDMTWFDNAGTIPCISNQRLKDFFITIPPYPEQTAIADFLDTKCAEIDSLLEDLDNEVKTLNEYKKSIIAETVTHGLNPNAKFVETNLGWIDKIPQNWNIEKFRYKLKTRRISGHGDKQVLSVYREFGVIPKDSRDDNHNVTSEDTSKYKYVRPNDFVINKMKAWQGSMGVSDYEGIVSPAYFVYEFIDDEYNPRYFHYFMRNANNIPEYRRLSGGIREGQWDLSPYDLGNMPVIIPPKSEQYAIVSFLDEKCQMIDDSISEKLQQIEALKEYKASLIYEYVTGKKQVI